MRSSLLYGSGVCRSVRRLPNPSHGLRYFDDLPSFAGPAGGTVEESALRRWRDCRASVGIADHNIRRQGGSAKEAKSCHL